MERPSEAQPSEKTPPRISAETSTTDASGSKDEALALAGERAREIDPALERRVLRKIDLFLMPAMVIGYGLVYYDKAILGSAVLFGMTADLHLTVVDHSTKPPTTNTDRLSWATSLFYFGMLAGLYPMSFALQKFNIGRILGPIVVLWGGICMCTAAVQDWRGLFVQRFALGFVESIIPTGFSCIVSSYYTQREQTFRQAWWFSGTGLFTIIGSALNYGFGQITGGDLRRWQYIYLLAGALTIIFGGWCFLVPNSPVSAWFLTPDERIVAVERLRKGQTGVRCKEIKMYQIKEALLDVKVYLIFIMMGCAYTVNGAVAGFGPLIVSTFGWNTLQSILLQFPVGGISWLGILLAGFIPLYIRNVRIFILVLCCLPVIVGCALIWKAHWTHHAAAPVVGYSIIGFFGPVVSLIIALGMSNVAGATKKSFMSAAIFVAYCVGNIVGPQLIKSQTRREHYPELWTGLIIFYCITIAASCALYYVMWRENKRRDVLNLDEEDADRLAFRDLTDKENLHFRYVL
ncbi:allantoate transport protein, partial [Aureobasidium melanogenum]|jgi:MFS family permease